MLQIYTGKGKGKTTAAIGLAIRSIGAGHKVFFLQFMKSLAYSEQSVLKTLSPQLILMTTGKPFFVAEEGMLTDVQLKQWGGNVVVFPRGKPPDDYVQLIYREFSEAERSIMDMKPDLLVLDEVNVALYFNLIAREAIESLLEELPKETEVVCTGRNAPQWLLDRADLITEMQEIRHYYTQGVEARKGIEH